MYALYPGEPLRLLRAQFTDYEVFEVHDAHGRAEFTAVLKQPHRASGTAVLLCASTVGGLRAKLQSRGVAPLRLVPAQRSREGWNGGPDAA